MRTSPGEQQPSPMFAGKGPHPTSPVSQVTQTPCISSTQLSIHVLYTWALCILLTFAVAFRWITASRWTFCGYICLWQFELELQYRNFHMMMIMYIMAHRQKYNSETYYVALALLSTSCTGKFMAGILRDTHPHEPMSSRGAPSPSATSAVTSAWSPCTSYKSWVPSTSTTWNHKYFYIRQKEPEKIMGQTSELQHEFDGMLNLESQSSQWQPFQRSHAYSNSSRRFVLIDTLPVCAHCITVTDRNFVAEFCESHESQQSAQCFFLPSITKIVHAIAIDMMCCHGKRCVEGDRIDKVSHRTPYAILDTTSQRSSQSLRGATVMSWQYIHKWNNLGLLPVNLLQPQIREHSALVDDRGRSVLFGGDESGGTLSGFFETPPASWGFAGI